jgi:hypothetical protein
MTGSNRTLSSALPHRPRPLALALACTALGVVLDSFCAPLLYAQAAACAEPLYFSIPPQSLDAALLSFAQQARISVLFPGEQYRQLRSDGVQGNLCPEEALERLLAGLAVRGSINNRQLVLTLQEQTPAAQTPPAAEALAAAETATGGGLLRSIIDSLFGRDDEARQRDDGRREDLLPSLEEITITGTRITRDGMSTPTPVTSVQARQIDVLAPDLLAEGMSLLPQFLSNSGPSTVGSVTGPSGS